MPETSVRYKTTADIRDLQKLNEELIRTAKSLDAVTAAKRRADSEGDRGGGGGGGGRTGTTPQGAPDGARPTPGPPGPGGAPSGAPSFEGQSGWWFEQDRRRRVGAMSEQERDAYESRREQDEAGHARVVEDENRRLAEQQRAKEDASKRWDDRRASAGSFIGRTASTAIGTGIGMGLGSSLIGFLLGSGEKFASLDRQLGQLGQRFQMSGKDAVAWGAALGYTMEQTAELDKALGGVDNKLNVGRAKRYAGFSRVTGMDPGTAMPLLATIGRQTGGQLSNAQLASITGGASQSGMGQGRLEEYLQTLSQLTLAQQQSTGRGSLGGAEALTGLASSTFKGSSLGQGAQGMDFLNRLQGVMTGGGALDIYLMRAMGFGKDPKLSYVDMRKRIEGGIFNPNNMADLFGSMQKQGLGKNQQFMRLDAVSGGQLKAFEIEALISRMNEKGAVEQLRNQANNPEAVTSMLAGVRGARSGDFAAMGSGTVTMGEQRAVKIEQMQYQVGGPVLEAMNTMTDTMMEVAKIFKDVFGVGAGGVLVGAANAAKTAVGAVGTTIDVFQKEGVAGVLERMLFALETIASWITGAPPPDPNAPPPPQGQGDRMNIMQAGAPRR